MQTHRGVGRKFKKNMQAMVSAHMEYKINYGKNYM